MVNVAYSTPDEAVKKGLEYFYEIEQNVYVCSISYPSGVEYHLKKKIVSECNCIKKYELTDKHKFRELSNALKAVNYFKELGRRFCVKRKYEENKSYLFVKYYYLCST